MTGKLGLAAGGVAVVLAAVLLLRPWDATADPRPGPRERFAGERAPPGTDPAPEPPARESFGQGRGPAALPKPPAIDGERAVKYLNQLCDLGPRVSGSDAMAKQQKFVTEHFEKFGGKVTRQEFKGKQPSRRDEVPMANLVAAWHPDRKRRVILCSHYDTRPSAHQENPASWNRPFTSANDGTAGAALLMEFAHHLSDLPTAVGVDLVLFDGEEYILDPGVPNVREGDKYFLGSGHFAAEYAKSRTNPAFKYEAAVLFDLFAHPGARLAVEGYSWQFAPRLVTDIWKTAEGVGAKSFKFESGYKQTVAVLDDHVPLNQAGIPAVDVMDFDYPHWHRLTDTPDKCSAGQLAEVGRVVTVWLQGVK